MDHKDEPGGIMRDLTNEILELIRRTSSSLPKDVEERLRAWLEPSAR